MRTVKYLKLFCLISGLNLVGHVYAQQDFVVFSGSFETFPDSKLSDVTNRPNLTNVETRLGNYKFHMAYPLAGSPETKMILLGKVSYEQLEFDFNTDSLPRYQPDRLHELGVELSLRSRFNNKWFLTVLAKPNVASDFENIGGKHINFDAGLIFNRRSSERFVFGFGARYTTDFGEPLVLPAFMLQWTNQDNFKVNALLPKHLELMWLPGPAIEIGLAGRVSGNHYRIGEEAVLQNNVSLEEGRIKYSVLTIGPAFRFGLSRNVFIAIEGGAALTRRFKVFDSNGNEIDTLDLERSFTLRGGLQVRR